MHNPSRPSRPNVFLTPISGTRMKMVRSSLLRGAALSTLPFLWACSGTMESSPSTADLSDPIAGEQQVALDERAQVPANTDPENQDPQTQDPNQAARLITESLNKARSAAEARRWAV